MSDEPNNIAPRSGGNGMAMVAKPQGTGLESVEQQRALGELQAQIMLAKLYPRDEQLVLDKLKRLDCTRIALAQVAEYSFTRGGQDVSGPSIRIMEAIARRWGNVQSGIKEVSRGETEGVGYSECIAYAWDLETGYRDEKQFRVRHLRDTRRGPQKLNDERDVYELIANMGARRKRSCLEAVIPGDIVEEVVDECRKTLHAEANTSPEALKKLLAAFAALGVSQGQIERKIGRNLGAIRPAQVLQLRRVYAAIQDGLTTPAAEFEPVEAPPPPARTPAPRAAQQPPARPPGSAPQPPPSDPPAEPPTAPEPPPPPPQPPQPLPPAAAAEPIPEPEEADEMAFGHVVSDANGEPIDGEILLDPLLWAQGFLDAWTRADNADRAALLAHNADALQDARAMSPEADALLDGLEAELAETGEVEPERDFVADSSPGRLNAAPEPQDKDERIAQTILTHLPTLQTGQDVVAYSQSQTVMTPIKRWQKEGRTGLVTSVKSAFTERLAALKRGDG